MHFRTDLDGAVAFNADRRDESRTMNADFAHSCGTGNPLPRQPAPAVPQGADRAGKVCCPNQEPAPPGRSSRMPPNAPPMWCACKGYDGTSADTAGTKKPAFMRVSESFGDVEGRPETINWCQEGQRKPSIHAGFQARFQKIPPNVPPTVSGCPVIGSTRQGACRHSLTCSRFGPDSRAGSDCLHQCAVSVGVP